MLRRLRSLSRVIKSRRDFEQGMTEELRFHIEQYTDDLVRSGVPPREAARRARIEFGSLNSVQEECREARGLHPFDELAQATAPRRPIAAQDTRIHGNCPRDPRRLPRREPDDLRGGRLHPAPPPAVSRGRPAGHHLQYLPQSRRRSRRFLDQPTITNAAAGFPPSPRSPSIPTARRSSARPAQRNASRSRACPRTFSRRLGRVRRWGAVSRTRKPRFKPTRS